MTARQRVEKVSEQEPGLEVPVPEGTRPWRHQVRRYQTLEVPSQKSIRRYQALEEPGQEL